jgi:periplasmic copper chaperone A
MLASCGGGTPDVRISDAWARETVAGQSGTAGYMTIENRGSGDERLLGISAPPPVKATLHETTMSNGVSSMRPVESGIAIPASKTIQFKPGGAHVMISGLTKPLRAGETLKLILRFQRSGENQVEFTVASATGELSH